MPEIVTKYKLFIASPSDLNEDRKAIDEVIHELNLTFGQQNNLVLELLKWETHSAPGISEKHPQELINKDIGSTYDLFIGLMWLKFGTPTSIAGSGTEEEFYNAYCRFEEHPNSLQILFYFNNSLPKSLQDINPQELDKINNFKKKIGDEKVLYWNYNTTEQLQSFLRIHIPKRILNLISEQVVIKKNIEILEVDMILKPDDELGLLDFLEIIETRFETSTNAVLNITEATEWIAAKLLEKTDDINKIAKMSFQPNTHQLRRVLKLTAQVMNEYASRIDVEIPIFFENYEDGIKAFSSIVNLADDFFDHSNIDELIEARQTIIEMNAGITQGLDPMEEFYNSIIQLPRIDKEINRAKKNVSEKVQLLVSKMQTSSELAIMLINEISEKITRIEITFANPQ
ncbi:MAG: hypothetical protein CVU05_15940 [Bacteroidetes bacterium HGW-Bacteroidetes-21]|nr:MAG: hypothetical protein CVU05_15940 [Bacteroidetes bacterium HGW-Bacteroidetes-21]